VIRTFASPGTAADAVRRTVKELEPDLALYWVSTMEEVIEQATAGTRYLAVLLTSFSLLAVALAIVGVYGVMAYVVGQRHREMGVRIAMGATRADVLRFVLGHGTRRAVTGVAVGVFASILLRVGILRPFVIDIGPVDAASQGGAAVIILAAALVASVVPAYRASRVDPMEALRHE
jgi:ABC-type antimicrobial peptide transport system permease subunit